MNTFGNLVHYCTGRRMGDQMFLKACVVVRTLELHKPVSSVYNSNLYFCRKIVVLSEGQVLHPKLQVKNH